MATNLAPNEQASDHDLSQPDDLSSSTFQLSGSQFSQVLETIQRSKTAKEGSFAKCTARFNGCHDYAKVVDFVSTATIYKDIEHITDENAIRGLPLLLEGHAATWWRGVKTTVKTWKETTDLIRATFAPRKPAHQVYIEIFRDPQDAKTATDIFISKKRAILSELPTLPTEEVQIDMLYGLLRFHLRDRISRDSVKTFTDLVKRARRVEALEGEARKQEQQKHLEDRPLRRGPKQRWKERSRCTICRKFGHNSLNCRHRTFMASARQQQAKNHTTHITARPPLKCYGCGKPGVVRSKCPECNKTTTPASAQAAFCSVDTMTQPRPRPTVILNIAGERGLAYLDTGAKCCVASQSLVMILKKKGLQFEKKLMQVALADGNPRVREVMITKVELHLEGRTIPTQFIVLSGSKDDRTLLGMDFLEDAGIVINTPQRSWHFVEKPDNGFDFHDETGEVMTSVTSEVTPATTKKTNWLQDYLEEVADEFLAPPPPLLSPIKSPRQRSRTEVNVKWSGIDTLFERCLRHCQPTRMDIAAVEINDLREDEAVSITPQETEMLRAVLKLNSDLFRGTGPPTAEAIHRINTGDHSPIAVPPYRLPPAKRELL